MVWFFDNSAAVRVASQRRSGACASDRVEVRCLCMSLREMHRIVTRPLPHHEGVGSWWIDPTGAPRGRGPDRCGQATKGVWGMSWRQEATKGVEDCDKPGEAVKRALIPGSPNHPAANP